MQVGGRAWRRGRQGYVEQSVSKTGEWPHASPALQQRRRSLPPASSITLCPHCKHHRLPPVPLRREAHLLLPAPSAQLRPLCHPPVSSRYIVMPRYPLMSRVRDRPTARLIGPRPIPLLLLACVNWQWVTWRHNKDPLKIEEGRRWALGGAGQFRAVWKALHGLPQQGLGLGCGCWQAAEPPPHGGEAWALVGCSHPSLTTGRFLGRIFGTWPLRLSLKAAYAAGRAAAGGASGGGIRQPVRAPSTHPAPARLRRVAIPLSQCQHRLGAGELVAKTGHARVAGGRRWRGGGVPLGRFSSARVHPSRVSRILRNHGSAELPI